MFVSKLSFQAGETVINSKYCCHLEPNLFRT